VFHDQSGGGVTFSGGEPLMQPDFLLEMLRECKTRDIHTVVDTSCYAPTEVIDRVSPYVDLFLCDIKHMDSECHQHLTGVPNELILENIKRIAASGKRIALRIPLIPSYNEDRQHLEAVGTFAASLGAVERIDILPCNEGGAAKSARLGKEPATSTVTRPADTQVGAAVETLRSFGLVVGVGG
jgi:pyruvate formate lyase activating enzyme